MMWRRKPELEDMCTYNTGNRQFLENSLVVVTDILLFSCAGACELTFSKCLVWCRWKSLNLQPLFSGPRVGVGWISKWLVVLTALKLGNYKTSFIFDISKIAMAFDRRHYRGSCRKCLLVCNVKVSTNCCHHKRLMYQATHWSLSWTTKGKIYIFWFWRMLKRWVYLCQNKANVKELDDSNISFKNSIHLNNE